MKTIRTIITLVMLLLMQCVTCEAKIWAILIADTVDETIGNDDLKSNRDLNNELKAIAKCLGTPISIINIMGREAYDKRNLARAIREIKPTDDDIVFFYFNGHGFRFDNQKDAYPNICMMPQGEDEQSGYVATTDIYNSIREKGARLNIVITDCCNSRSGSYKPSLKRNTVFSREQPMASKQRMKQLFMESKGDILATAAKPGEYSYSIDGVGSILTNALIASLRSEARATRKTPVSWQRILDNAFETARKETLDCENAQHGLRYVKLSGKY